MVETYSWSSLKMDLWGLVFFYRHVLGRPLEWIQIVKPPPVQSLPDIPSLQEAQRLIKGVRRLVSRVFFLVVYSLGLRLGEALDQEVGDIDAQLRRVYIRNAKGGKDRYVRLPELTLQNLRRFWTTHRQRRSPLPHPAARPCCRPSLRGLQLDRGQPPPFPKKPGGHSIEGLAATPSGGLLIGLRNPLVDRNRALVIPLQNPAEVLEGRTRPLRQSNSS